MELSSGCYGFLHICKERERRPVMLSISVRSSSSYIYTYICIHSVNDGLASDVRSDPIDKLRSLHTRTVFFMYNTHIFHI